jgi:chromosome segregation ATPase
MNKLGSFFGRKPSVPIVSESSVAAEKITAPESLASPPEPQKPQNVVVELDNELFLPLAKQLGEENETIRNLLIDAEQKVNELDAIKREIGKLAEPVIKSLRALDEAKSELSAAEIKVAMLESECTQLRETLTETQRKLTALESTSSEQMTELAARRAQVAELQGRVLQQSGEIQVAHDENRRLGERMALADKKSAQLESEGEATRQKLIVSENERITAQKSLDKAFAEMSKMSQRVLDSDKVLANTQVRLHSAEHKLTETQTEHRRLAIELDDAKQKHQSEIASYKRNYATLQSRIVMTNKLLEDMRKSMMVRAEEIQSFDRRLAESLQPPAEAHSDTEGSPAVAGRRGQGDPAKD